MKIKEKVFINYYDNPEYNKKYGAVLRDKDLAEANCYSEGQTIEGVIEFDVPEKEVTVTKERINQIYKSWGNSNGVPFFKDFLIKILFEE